MPDDRKVDDLWERFRDVVTMTPEQLVRWLGAREEWADERSLRVGRGPGGLGASVVQLLRKRRAELTRGDAEVMRAVVAVVDQETAGAPDDGDGGGDRRRYRLWSVGHDTLRGPTAPR